MMGKVIMSGIVPQLEYEAPVTGIALSTLAEGSVVKLNENGTPVEFYIAKHNYESSLNGAGRTLLVRKDCYNSRRFHSANIMNGMDGNDYSNSEIDSWLNSTYKSVLDATVQSIIGTTKIYYTTFNQSAYAHKVSTIQRGVFILSMAELGVTPASGESYVVEGSALPIRSSLLTAYLNGSAVWQWTRTIRSDYNYGAGVWCINGGTQGTQGSTSSYGSRPCFTLPATTLFDPETLLFKEVS